MYRDHSRSFPPKGWMSCMYNVISINQSTKQSIYLDPRSTHKKWQKWQHHGDITRYNKYIYHSISPNFGIIILQVYYRLSSNLNEICYLILVYTCLINPHMIIDYHILWTFMNHIYIYYYIFCWSIYDIYIYIASTHRYIYISFIYLLQ